MRTLLSLTVCLVLCGAASADDRNAISIRRPCPSCPNCPQPEDQDCHPLKIFHPKPDDDAPILKPLRDTPRLDPIPAKVEEGVGVLLALALTPICFVLVCGVTYVITRNIQERNENE